MARGLSFWEGTARWLWGLGRGYIKAFHAQRYSSGAGSTEIHDNLSARNASMAEGAVCSNSTVSLRAEKKSQTVMKPYYMGRQRAFEVAGMIAVRAEGGPSKVISRLKSFNSAG